MTPSEGKRFPSREAVDFVIVGSGAAGGVLARELSQAGFDVGVLEQGPYRTAKDFGHDEMKNFFIGDLTEHFALPVHSTACASRNPTPRRLKRYARRLLVRPKIRSM